MSEIINHEWHLVSNYCIHCGIYRTIDRTTQEKQYDAKCFRDDKVIAISHKINRSNVL
jgi:hypothetical protein